MNQKYDIAKKIVFLSVITLTAVLLLVAGIHSIVADDPEDVSDESVIDVIETLSDESLFSSDESGENVSFVESSEISSEESSEEISDISEEESEDGFIVGATHEYLDIYVKSPYCFVYNATDNVILFEKNSYDKAYPASVTKLLTAAVALEYVPSDTPFLVGEEILRVGYNSSMAYVVKGESYTLKDLLYGLLLPSGNDVAYTIAVNTSKHLYGDALTEDEAIEKFMELCNKKAIEIGAYNTTFTVPDGYHDDGHYTTAYDMALISLYASTFEEITEACKTYEYYCKSISGAAIGWRNTNPLINKRSEYYCPLVTGLKTGATTEAGKCLATTAEKDGKVLYIVILGAPDVTMRNTDMLNIIHSVFGECQ